jgi:catechol 2,3-dioxygenase-like lactoylglutathione lyase family enzyme
MPKVRHIAYRAQDVEAMADFFVAACEMVIVQRRANGAIDLSDGTINITLLRAHGQRADGQLSRVGIDHIGFTVEDEEKSARQLESAGARRVDAIANSTAHYEIKFKGPEDITIDLGRWVGATPLGVETDEPGSAPRPSAVR